MSRKPLSAVSLPSGALAALTRAGYNTVEDVLSSNAEAVSEDILISLSTVQEIFNVLKPPQPNFSQFWQSQSQPRASRASPSFPASSLPEHSQDSQLTSTQMPPPVSTPFGLTALDFTQNPPTRLLSGNPPLDNVLDGGLRRGHILEISGPPGTAKEMMTVGFVKNTVEKGDKALFMDMSNMTSPAILADVLGESSHLVHYQTMHSVAELLVSLHNLPTFHDDHPSMSLLVLSSLWFPIQLHSQSSDRTNILMRIKDCLNKACASRNISVVITMQLSTKLLNRDGTPGNFDTGSRAVLVPQLGPTYLPSGRTHRVIVVPQTRTTGILRLLSSPSTLHGSKGQAEPMDEPYETVDGKMLSPRNR